MKLKFILSTSLFAAIAALSISAQAASDMDKAAEAKTEQMKMKPHSHVEEKTGIQQKAPEAVVNKKPNAAEDKSKHYHPRDGK